MRIFLILLIIITSNSTYSQVYRTTSGELIFSRSLNNSPFPNTTSHIRISAFFHFNNNYHYDLTENLGVYSGFCISNIGFIYKNGDTIYKKRAYTLGVPLAIKFGNLKNNNFLFAGGELELPFHYKQKRIIDGQKIKYSSFFDERVNLILPSVFAGIQFSNGFCFKSRIYLKDFLNKEFSGIDFGSSIDYKENDSKLFMLSLSYTIKENKMKKMIKTDTKYASLEI